MELLIIALNVENALMRQIIIIIIILFLQTAVYTFVCFA